MAVCPGRGLGVTGPRLISNLGWIWVALLILLMATSPTATSHYPHCQEVPKVEPLLYMAFVCSVVVGVIQGGALDHGTPFKWRLSGWLISALTSGPHPQR